MTYAPTALKGVRFALPVPKFYVADGFVLGASRTAPRVIGFSDANPDGPVKGEKSDGPRARPLFRVLAPRAR